MAKLDVEQVDLEELVEVLRTRQEAFVGSLDGRSHMRDAVVLHLGCSMLEAEELVDTLIAQGFARLERSPEGREGWRLAEEQPRTVVARLGEWRTPI